MARSDLVLNLVRAGSLGDEVGFRRTVEAMIAEAREHQHHVVADRLAEYLALVQEGAGARRLRLRSAPSTSVAPSES